ncbi:MAG: hypothetical protein WD066_01205 [Planctomycetaceae bacterium]
MNEQQRLYLVQARSDWRVHRRLKSEPVCHRLHYSQMCTEKLAKAFFWRSPGAGNLGHAAFVKFIRAIATNQNVAKKLGWNDARSFREWIKDVSDLAYELQALAPSLANDGPNPEYPWPRNGPQHAPVEHDFAAWRRIQTANGRHLWIMIDKVLENFDEWF